MTEPLERCRRMALLGLPSLTVIRRDGITFSSTGCANATWYHRRDERAEAACENRTVANSKSSVDSRQRCDLLSIRRTTYRLRANVEANDAAAATSRPSSPSWVCAGQLCAARSRCLSPSSRRGPAAGRPGRVCLVRRGQPDAGPDRVGGGTLRHLPARSAPVFRVHARASLFPLP